VLTVPSGVPGESNPPWVVELRSRAGAVRKPENSGPSEHFYMLLGCRDDHQLSGLVLPACLLNRWQRASSARCLHRWQRASSARCLQNEARGFTTPRSSKPLLPGSADV
jgi:hypothetical protein